jgi:hypothetical protein
MFILPFDFIGTKATQDLDNKGHPHTLNDLELRCTSAFRVAASIFMMFSFTKNLT